MPPTSQTAVSEVYQPPGFNTLQDEPFEGHYQDWGYSIGYEMDASGQPTPEGGNTAVFRVFPHGMTEPVLVTKPEENTTFTINVLSGEGQLIRVKADDKVEELPLSKGSQVVIRPGEAYLYRNTGKNEDLVLHDEAQPAFMTGDDMELARSYLPDYTPQPKDGYLACLAKTSEGSLKRVDLPAEFYDRVGQALREDPYSAKMIAELNRDIKFNAGMALSGLAMFGAGLYGNYSAITGKHNGFDLLSWPTGLTTVGAGATYAGVHGTITNTRRRFALRGGRAAPGAA